MAKIDEYCSHGIDDASLQEILGRRPPQRVVAKRATTKIYEYVRERGGGTLQVARHKTLAATQRALAKSWREIEDLEDVIVLEVEHDVVTAAWEHDYDLDAWFATKDYSYLVGEKLVDIG